MSRDTNVAKLLKTFLQRCPVQSSMLLLLITHLLTRSLASVSDDCQRRPRPMGNSEKVFCGAACTKEALAALKDTFPGIPPSKERTKDMVRILRFYYKSNIKKKKKKNVEIVGACQIKATRGGAHWERKVTVETGCFSNHWLCTLGVCAFYSCSLLSTLMEWPTTSTAGALISFSSTKLAIVSTDPKIMRSSGQLAFSIQQMGTS